MNCECKKCGYKWVAQSMSPKRCPNEQCKSRIWRTGIKSKRGPKGNTIEKFWRRVDKSGRGYFHYYNRVVQVHRFSYELHHGPIPDGLFVCHKCDVPLCVNPYHLFLGTAQDNSNDCVNKGRIARGERSGTSKLNESQVRAIREADLSGRGSTVRLARSMGISAANVRHIVDRKSWKHIEIGRE